MCDRVLEERGDLHRIKDVFSRLNLSLNSRRKRPTKSPNGRDHVWGGITEVTLSIKF